MFFSKCVVYGGLAHLGLSLYQVLDVYNASNWVESFTFDTEYDPALGYVNYIDYKSAVEKGMFSTDNDVVTFGADHDSTATGRGRNSIKLVTKKIYNHALVVADIAHMPSSVCGTWNAFWLNGTHWPMDGEIVIIEGINSNTENVISQHTQQGCTLSGADCSTITGCTQTAGGVTSYGDGFNANGGGVYAMEWTSDFIKVWFWPRGSQPDDLSGSPDPVRWGTPTASFTAGEEVATCEIDSYFRDQVIIFDTTFCGLLAESQFPLDPVCSSIENTCMGFVQNNPSAFAETYWAVNSVKVYGAVTNIADSQDEDKIEDKDNDDDDDDDEKDGDGDGDDVSDEDDEGDDSDDDIPKNKEHRHHHNRHHRHHRHHHHRDKPQATATAAAENRVSTI